MELKKLRLLGSGFTEEEYELYNLRQKSTEQCLQYLSLDFTSRIFKPIANSSHQSFFLEDKWASHHFFKSLGIPVPYTYGLYHPHYGVDHSGEKFNTPEDIEKLLKQTGPSDIILKPRGGIQGRNIISVNLDYFNNHVNVNSGYEQIAFDNFISRLSINSFQEYKNSYQGWIIQETVNQHERLAVFNPSSLNTVRIVTFVNASDDCEVHCALLRMGRKGKTTDNWSQGGIASHIDIGTGIAGPGFLKPTFGTGLYSKHPDTNATIKGEIIPFWQSTLDLCRRAALALPGARSVGWDVGITSKGPILIEGNADWGMIMMQIHNEGYLNMKRRQAFSLLGAEFPDRLPSAAESIIRLYKRGYGTAFRKKLFGRFLKKPMQAFQNIP
jgi:hypothetical protein